MKIYLSLNSIHKAKLLKVADTYYTKRAVEVAFRQNSASRETVVGLTGDQFKKLANPEFSQGKLDAVVAKLKAGDKFEDLPFLGVETNKDGNVQVANNGDYHEGRHRMLALAQLGVKLLPVRIKSLEHGEGRCYRWGDTDKRPKTLTGYNGYTILFPEIETY